jgi:predicted regulator of Ras-like GTPase activity (Roadblock/LC7/MglB family)
MKLIQKLKIWKELKRLEARVRQSPSPSTFVDLGQVYINLGMHERTLELADEGLALFPQSNELRKLRRFANKTSLNRRIREVRDAIQKNPTAEHYLELATIYLELGDIEAVQSACEECLRRFPGHSQVHLVLARAWLTIFYRDLSARAGLHAIEHLRKLLKIEPGEAAAHRLMAEVGWRIGANRTVRRHIDELYRLEVVDAEIDAMRDEIGEPAADEELEALFHAVERRGSLVRGPVFQQARSTGGGGRETPGNRIRDALAQVVAIEGVRKAAYIRGAKAVVRGEIRDGQDGFLRIARVVARAAQRAARRMDVGSFNKGVVDADGERICLCSYGEVLAAVACDATTSTEVVLDELQELVAGSLIGTERDS